MHTYISYSLARNNTVQPVDEAWYTLKVSPAVQSEKKKNQNGFLDMILTSVGEAQFWDFREVWINPIIAITSWSTLIRMVIAVRIPSSDHISVFKIISW